MDPYDLDALFAYREALAGLDPEDAPTLRPLQEPPPCRSVALLPGSFNPPTAAHLLLAERALREGFDCVALVLARVVVGKRDGGLIPEDRLLALATIAEPPGRVVAVSSCGLYADQAQAAREAFPGAEVTFLVGSDKVMQIFEHRWYDDRDRALERLFDAARLLAAPRADDGDRVREVLDRPENRRFAERVEILRLHPAVSDLSSTRVRGLLQSGADPSGLLPPPVAELLAEVRAFQPPCRIGDREEVNAYGLRARMLDALWRLRDEGARPDFRDLMRFGLEPGEEAARLRDALTAAETGARAVADLLAGRGA